MNQISVLLGGGLAEVAGADVVGQVATLDVVKVVNGIGCEHCRYAGEPMGLNGSELPVFA